MTLDLNLITVLISASALLFSVFSWFKNSGKVDQKEIIERTKENTTINMKLDSILSTIADIKSDYTQIRKELLDQDKRIVKVEDSARSAHHRLDGIETRLNIKRNSDGEETT